MENRQPLLKIYFAYMLILGGFLTALATHGKLFDARWASLAILIDFGVGWTLLFYHWSQTADVGARGMLGCVGLMLLALLCFFALCSAVIVIRD